MELWPCSFVTPFHFWLLSPSPLVPSLPCFLIPPPHDFPFVHDLAFPTLLPFVPSPLCFQIPSFVFSVYCSILIDLCQKMSSFSTCWLSLYFGLIHMMSDAVIWHIWTITLWFHSSLGYFVFMVCKCVIPLPWLTFTVGYMWKQVLACKLKQD